MECFSLGASVSHLKSGTGEFTPPYVLFDLLPGMSGRLVNKGVWVSKEPA